MFYFFKKGDEIPQWLVPTAKGATAHFGADCMGHKGEDRNAVISFENIQEIEVGLIIIDNSKEGSEVVIDLVLGDMSSINREWIGV
ncbi:hypothetical protein [Bacillus phage SP8]|uniref:Uncharacterized protein n=1 Tax=Bacillus phage Adastra TaxID=3143958 RepID=A0AAU8BD59_9CAUD|nr:hypothetical protein [Bacillus phage SP8]